ncbi:transcription antitermination factor NusB [Fibrobacterota bacterium]
MIQRRKGREFALQCLYALEIGQGDILDLKARITHGLGPDADEVNYGLELVDTVSNHVTEIDGRIEQHVRNWSLGRIAVIDKILMRLSAAELLYMESIPATVSITEAVQMAEKYSTRQSSAFINGVLDSLAKEISG